MSTVHFFKSSGTTNSSRWIEISQEALDISADSVMKWIGATRSDSWFLALPSEHIAGFMVIHRARRFSLPLHVRSTGSWSPFSFLDEITASYATLVSLVPKQLEDLIQMNALCPQRLRVVLLGGGNCGDALYQKARSLGWPILTTFAMTEAASSIAIAPYASLHSGHEKAPPPHVLPHWEAIVDETNTLAIKGPSLFSATWVEGIRKPATVDASGFFRTQDRTNLEGRKLFHVGRCDGLVKIHGYLIDLDEVRRRWRTVSGTGEIFIHQGELVVGHSGARSEDISSLMDEFNSNGLLPVRLQTAEILPNLPESRLGKIPYFLEKSYQSPSVPS